jgi:predicted transposase/invertase (TIGR01784 family)
MALQDRCLKLLKDVCEVFDVLAKAVPQEKREGKMDFACRLSGGEYALIEMQLARYTDFDMRALAYAGYTFGNQLHQGEDWPKLKKVIGISILGGGLRPDKAHWNWANTPEQCVQHYCFQEQLHQPSQYLDGIELIQYCLINNPENHNYTQLQKDRVTLLTGAHNMQEHTIKEIIQTEKVRDLFEIVKINQMDKESRDMYRTEDCVFQDDP